MVIKEHIKTGKVGSVRIAGQRYDIYINEADTNPYSIRRVWWAGGWHYKTLVKYADMRSCLYWLAGVE